MAPPSTGSAELDQIRAGLSQLFWPDHGTGDERRDRLRTARRAVGAGTVGATLVQVVVWLVIGVATRGVDTPWWLSTLVPGTVGVLALRLAEGAQSRRTESMCTESRR